MADPADPDERDAFARVSKMPPEYFAAAKERYPAARLSALRVFLALRTAARRVDNTVASWLDGSGVTVTKFDVLHLLYAAHPAGATNGELRDHLSMTQPNVTFVVKSLEREGLAKRTIDPSDRRIGIVTITARGRRLVDALTPAHLDAISAALATLDEDDRTRLIGSLATIAEGFEGQPPPH